MGVKNCILKMDSKVIASQIEKECMTRDDSLEKYLPIVRRMENYFKGFTVEHVERAKNTAADELAKVAVRKTTLPPDLFFQTIKDPSVKQLRRSLDW
jgi:ribonuclease HI